MDAFLSEVRYAIQSGCVTFNSRNPKNMKTLRALGMTVPQVYEEIQELTYEDYWYGPEPDNREGKTGDVWFFKKFIFYQLVYIKLEFVNISNNKTLVVMSFHLDNIP